MRALAALAVLEGHLWGQAHGYDPAATLSTFPRRVLLAGGAGVWVFFALSGYLLFWPFVRRHFAGGEPIRLGVYARNRALRIVPLYLTAVVVFMVVRGHASDGTLWWRHLLGVQAMWTDSINPVDAPLWSIAVEIQFYALLPFLAVVLAVASRRKKAVAAVLLLAAAAASLAARLLLDTDAGRPWAYQLPTTFLFFTAGMIVALLRQALLERPAARLGPPAAWLA